LAAPPSPPALPPASTKPSSSATGDNRIFGKGVLKAVANANTEIAKSIAGSTPRTSAPSNHRMIALDARTKSRLGANASSPSMAAARADRLAPLKQPLYKYLSRYSTDRPRISSPAQMT